MHTVREILSRKGERVWTIGPDETVFEGLRRMSQLSVGALVVTEHDRVVGIFSERDYARKVILKGKASISTPVREIMTAPVITATRDWDVERCMRIMTENRFRHLPVVEQDRLWGLISIGDVVKDIISEQGYIIEQLSRYMQVQID